MKKFTSPWRIEEQRRTMTATASRWIMWQMAKEVLRLVMELWLQT
ncbi:hypothetical protein ACGFYP_34590 [Streptomyces sp. NPDC048370]